MFRSVTSVALLGQMLLDHVTQSHMLQKRQQIEARVTPKPRDSEGLPLCPSRALRTGTCHMYALAVWPAAALWPKSRPPV